MVGNAENKILAENGLQGTGIRSVQVNTPNRQLC